MVPLLSHLGGMLLSLLQLTRRRGIAAAMPSAFDPFTDI